MYKVTFISFHETGNIESFNETQDTPPIPTEFVDSYGTYRGGSAEFMPLPSTEILKATHHYENGVIIVERIEE